jgi:hypothetical protein
LRLCADDEPIKLFAGDLSVAEVLAGLGYVELLPGCSQTFGITEKGERYLAETSATPTGAPCPKCGTQARPSTEVPGFVCPACGCLFRTRDAADTKGGAT